ncbi:hypothetical protein HGM15179_021041 [Zosterops borbonicus]|uniref:Uncharacterized protein n=1 Tax=Zosterops borbonicus TaxID=364589 RepID=A0A8K1D8K0_9PASS|nr:hypothetical protein HGM15179_021041 [Zosterops borbonicus]
MHSRNRMPLAAGTGRHNGLGLISGQFESSDQTQHILMEELVAELRLLIDVRQRGLRDRGSESISPPVSLRYEPRQIRVRPGVHHVKWLLSVD